MARRSQERPGRYAYERLDRALHERARLGILSALAAAPAGLRFGELKRLCTLTDGNLGRHLGVLHETRIVEIWKGYENRRPQTICRLTPEGRDRFAAYLDELGRVIRDAKPNVARRAVRLPAMPDGWSKA